MTVATGRNTGANAEDSGGDGHEPAPSNRIRTINLALQGGGAHGAFTWGVLDRLLDEKDLASVQKLYKAEDFDFRLKAGSAAIDRGVELPTITDGFTGRAPDLGALEFGRPAPTYGPRR